MSHPSWVCGLKRRRFKHFEVVNRSHPSWVCGLKHIFLGLYLISLESHPSWVCGLKQEHPGEGIREGSHTLRGCVD